MEKDNCLIKHDQTHRDSYKFNSGWCKIAWCTVFVACCSSCSFSQLFNRASRRYSGSCSTGCPTSNWAGSWSNSSSTRSKVAFNTASPLMVTLEQAVSNAKPSDKQIDNYIVLKFWSYNIIIYIYNIIIYHYI